MFSFFFDLPFLSKISGFSVVRPSFAVQVTNCVEYMRCCRLFCDCIADDNDETSQRQISWFIFCSFAACCRGCHSLLFRCNRFEAIVECGDSIAFDAVMQCDEMAKKSGEKSEGNQCDRKSSTFFNVCCISLPDTPAAMPVYFFDSPVQNERKNCGIIEQWPRWHAQVLTQTSHWLSNNCENVSAEISSNENFTIFQFLRFISFRFLFLFT